jgi:uncharacterized protein (TIGR02145 family)
MAQPALDDEGVVINGVRWATRNVDKPGTFAATLESAGMFYQWNRKEAWSDGNKYMTGIIEWEAANDPSPVGWRIPTREELASLYDTSNVSYERTTQRGVSGQLFTDLQSGNTLFMPAAGFRDSLHHGMLKCVDQCGLYWSNLQCNNSSAYLLSFGSDINTKSTENVLDGCSIRCVAK